MNSKNLVFEYSRTNSPNILFNIKNIMVNIFLIISVEMFAISSLNVFIMIISCLAQASFTGAQIRVSKNHIDKIFEFLGFD